MTPERWEKVKDLLATALEFDPQHRESYLNRSCQGDSGLKQQIELLLNNEHQAGTRFLNQHSLAEIAAELLPETESPWIGRRIGAYQIVEQIGTGGMGEVYRAFRADDTYRKEVALKLIRAGHDLASVIIRFKNERQILAGLEHPNIGRLLDGGTTERGTPYLVMELIEGEPIGDYCDKRKLSLDDRLKLFIQVCAAVQYAHQRLIIHRDIKPGNILVTADGTPKLLDFGIAKVFGTEAQAANETLTAYRALTPEFASPEQINGDQVTTASDVYSLGVVLYCLLTGRSLYPSILRNSQELATAICSREPEKPSTVVLHAARKQDSRVPAAAIAAERSSTPERLRKQLSGDLDNIVLMALRKDPARRYSSAERLAEDIHRHLRVLPVAARSDTLRYRTAKFVRRNKRGVAAVTAGLVFLLSSVALIAWEAQVARAQRNRAEHRFQDVRELANSLIFDVHDSIQELPGATTARKLIIDKALHYLDSLAKESQDDPSLQRELANAYQRIGDVQGNDLGASMGDTSSALNSYQKALAIRERLWNADHNRVEDALGYAASLRLLSQAQLFAGDLSPGLENARQSVSVIEPVEVHHANDPKVLLEIILDYQSVANILGGESTLSNLGDNAAALEYRRKQLATAERWSSVDPLNEIADRALAIALATMGDQLWQSGQISAPMRYYGQSRSRFQELVSRSPNVARTRYLLDLLCERMAVIYLAKGNVAAAEATAREGLSISKLLSGADPRDAQSGLTLAEDSRLVADLESRRGHNRSAAADIRTALDLSQRLAQASPRDTETLAIEAGAYKTSGDIAGRAKDYSTALHEYNSAITILSKIYLQNSSNAGAGARLAAIFNSAGKANLALSRTKAAGDEFLKSIAIVEPMANSGHPSGQALYTAADAYAGLGEVDEAVASNVDAKPEVRARRLQAAAWYARSLQEWGRIQEAGAVSPDGFDCIARDVISRRLALIQRTVLASSQQ